jgi:hypothetical protein
MNRPEWTLLDVSEAPLLNEHPFQCFGNFVKKWDEANKYNYAQSAIVEQCIEKINEELAPLGFSVMVIAQERISDIKLIAPSHVTLLDRMLATSIFIDTLNRLDEEMEHRLEKAIFQRYAPSSPIGVAKVSIEEFVQRIQASKKLWLLEAVQGAKTTWSMKPSEVCRSNYGGGRTDRLAERNRFTNFIGMPNASGASFWSVDDAQQNGGTFLADVVRHYGVNGYVFMDDNVILDLQHDLSMDGGACGYSSVSPTTPQDYSALKRAVKKHLSSFESYQALNA